MKTIRNISKKPAAFQRIFGVSLKQFDLLVAKFKIEWDITEKERLGREKRQRKIGGGHPYSLQLIEEKLLLILMYYKAYPTQELLGFLFDIDQSNVSRLFRKIMPLLEKAADPSLRSYLKKAKETADQERISSLEQLTKKFPELRDVSTDATEQECYRSSNYEIQKKYYSGKSKSHTIKTQISVSKEGKILDVSNSYPGSVHDKAIIDQEKTVQKFSKIVPQRFDSGYQGLVAQNPEYYLILPIKKPRGGELTRLEKEINTANSKRRVIAEHGFSRAKKFKIMGSRFRNRSTTHNTIFRGIAAILNFRLENQLIPA